MGSNQMQTKIVTKKSHAIVMIQCKFYYYQFNVRHHENQQHNNAQRIHLPRVIMPTCHAVNIATDESTYEIHTTRSVGCGINLDFLKRHYDRQYHLCYHPL